MNTNAISLPEIVHSGAPLDQSRPGSANSPRFPAPQGRWFVLSSRLPLAARRFARFFALLAWAVVAQPALDAHEYFDDHSFPPALVVFDTADFAQLERLVTELERDGVITTHIFPPAAVICRVPTETEASITGRSYVRLMTRSVVPETNVLLEATETAMPIRVWNQLVRSERTVPGQTIPILEPIAGDAMVPPDKLQGSDALGHQNADSTVTGPSSDQTSEYMIGRIAVGIVFPESAGSMENWSSNRQDIVLAKIVDGCEWWRNQGGSRARISFLYDIRRNVPTSYEPIQLPQTDDKLWIAEVLRNLGQPGTFYFSQARAYAAGLRSRLNSDWAFTTFVVDSLMDSNGRFADGLFAYAYLGGPFMVMTYDNNGYGISNMNKVFAHEMGHIFGASDEYAGTRLSCEASGYLNIRNGNHVSCTSSGDPTCMMRGGLVNGLCSFSRGQVGWRDSDNDGLFDPIDTVPILTLNSAPSEHTAFVVGIATDMPYPSPTHRPCTINSILAVDYRLDLGPWLSALPEDGTFEEASEAYRIPMASVSPGTHSLEVRARSSSGSVTSLARTVVQPDPISFTISGSTETPDHAWRTGGAAPWSGQILVFHDGQDAALSGAISAGQESWMESDFNGPARLRFWWKALLRSTASVLRLSVDGQTVALISDDRDWSEATITLEDGSHSVRWSVANGGAERSEGPQGWVDSITLTPMPKLVYVDWRYGNPDFDGSEEHPYPEFALGYEAIAPSGEVRLRSGSYLGLPLLRKRATITSGGGLVRLYRDSTVSSQNPDATDAAVNEPPSGPTIRRVGDSFTLEINGRTGRSVALESSVDLVAWTRVTVIQPTNDLMQLPLEVMSNEPIRFYRLVDQ
ncbi:MAG: hypothetical protein JNK85_29720 [Verrucomicrobiales bacterium]|nr:hypothetical protein [Verrucomicrobiales bacterium]